MARLSSPLRTASRLLAGVVLVGVLAWLPLSCGGERAPEPGGAGGAGPAGSGVYDAEGRALRPLGKPARRPNLILILIDTLRADSLSAAEPARGVMPQLAALAGRGVAFEHAVAPAPWTLPSVVSLLTGLLPSAHRQSGAVMPPPSTAPLTFFSEILAASYGYDTAAFVGLPQKEGPRAMFAGFDTLESDFLLQAASERLPRWASARRPDQPFFLLLHTYEAHDAYGEANHPYPVLKGAQVGEDELLALGPNPEPAALTRRYLTDARFKNALRDSARRARWMPEVVGFMFDGLTRTEEPSLGPDLHRAYREGAAWVDGLLGRTLALLEQLGLTKDALLVVASDHGEAFGEHGALQHQRWLYDELLRVPLVMHGPAPFDAPRLVRGSVALHDILPTFFDWAGFALPEGLEGRSFLPLLGADGPGRIVVSEEVRLPQATGGRSRALLVSTRSRAWKYLITHELLDDSVREELYDLERNPAESANRFLARPALPSLPAEMVAAIEQARDRVFDPALRGLPGTPPPATPRPAPFAAEAAGR